MSIVSIPFSFTGGTPAIASQVNADFSALATVLNGQLDATNVNSVLGFYASQIIPTTGAQAAFGGTSLYTFPAGLTAGGPVTASQFNGSGAGLTAGSIPASALASGAYVDLTTNQTVGGVKTFTAGLTGPGVNVDGTGGYASSFAGMAAGVRIAPATNGQGTPVLFGTNAAFTVTNWSISDTGAASFKGVAVGGALTGATTGAFASTLTAGAGTSVFGDGISNTRGVVNGANAGVGGGSAFIAQGGGTSFIAIGNKSNILGGTYDATPFIFGSGPISTNVGMNIGGPITIPGSNAANNPLTFPNLSVVGGSNHTTTIASNSTGVQGVPATVFGIADNGNAFTLSADGNGNLGVLGRIFATGFIANSAAPVVAAGQFAYGAALTTTANAGTAGAPPAQVAGYVICNTNGTTVKIPYYAV
jgi:hypothetical protein